MDKLSKFQNDFVTMLFEEDNIPDFLKDISPAGSLSPEEAIQVYRKDYKCRLLEVMTAKFEAVCSIIGLEDFMEVASDYIEQNASESYDLEDYGRKFPIFLGQTRLAKNAPYIEDLAKFEIDFGVLFHSEVPKGIKDFSDFSEDTLMNATWEFSCCLKLFGWSCPIFGIWKNRGMPRDEILNDLDLNRPSYMALFKKGSQVEAKELSPNQFKLLKALKNRSSMSQAFDQINMDPNETSEVFSFLALNRLVRKLSIN